MSDASLAMQVPAAIAKPTSAAARAGASLVPSPGGSLGVSVVSDDEVNEI
jgi:hypothetical protein